MNSDVVELSKAQLHESLDDPSLVSMNFLNEIANDYPEAISFAPGRPFEGFFNLEALPRYLDTYRKYLADEGLTEDEVRRTIFQYGRTKGVIHRLVARNLEVDEGIVVDPESIVVTVGCQEAMFLVLRALRATDRDVLLAVAPTYVGLTGAARLVNLPVLPVAGGETGVDLADLVDAVRRARSAGLRPRALYVMPDFANPSGLSLDVAARRELLRVAEQEDLLLLEDNPYGLFHGEGGHRPTLKVLDEGRRVVYLGTFAKTAFPGARIGFVVADQRVADGDRPVELFADHLSKIKSMLTVNTSPIAQAVVAGKLLEFDCSLVKATVDERAHYRKNLARTLDGLARRFPAGSGVTWNAPSGGFFVVLTMPFPIDDDLLRYSAREHGVLWTPMHHFVDGGGATRQLRLSVSLLTPEEIDAGLDRFAAMVAAHAVA